MPEINYFTNIPYIPPSAPDYDRYGFLGGGFIRSGRIVSKDERTYFDLDQRRIIVNDGTNDRILIGFQEGGF